MKVNSTLALILAAALVSTAVLAQNSITLLFHETFDKGVPSTWKDVKFEGHTSYRVLKEETNSVLQASATNSASGLACEMNLPTTRGTTLSWRWKIDKVPPGASIDRKATFDHAARLFVSFKTRLGPPRVINYAWTAEGKPGQIYDHPSSGRSRFIILESGNADAGKWKSEKRDLFADYKLLFDDSEPPAITAIGLMTDSDGTKSSINGYYDDLMLVRQ